MAKKTATVKVPPPQGDTGKGLDKQFVVRAPQLWEAVVESIARSERERKSDVLRALLERGVFAYHMDGVLEERKASGQTIEDVFEIDVNMDERPRK